MTHWGARRLSAGRIVILRARFDEQILDPKLLAPF